jgi:hypothetical protein
MVVDSLNDLPKNPQVGDTCLVEGTLLYTWTGICWTRPYPVYPEDDGSDRPVNSYAPV